MAAPLEAIVVQLLTAIQAIAGYPMPAELPEIAFVPHSYLEERVCQRPCDVQGWFPPGTTIYLDDKLDPQNDLWARSILLHELVHYAQQEEGAFLGKLNCDIWKEREREAYDVQIRWLASQRASRRLLQRISWPYLRITCKEDGGKQ